MCVVLMMNYNATRRIAAPDTYRQRYKGYAKRRFNNNEGTQIPIDEDQELSISKLQDNHPKKRENHGIVYRLPTKTLSDLSHSKESILVKQDQHTGLSRETSQVRQKGSVSLQKIPENTKTMHPLSLQKGDRSYSEPVIFPPISGQSGISPRQVPSQTLPSKPDSVTKIAPPDKSKNEAIRNIGIKFPIVSRQELYKHLGIPMEGTVYRRTKNGGRRSKMGGSIERHSRAPTRNTDLNHLKPPTPALKLGNETERTSKNLSNQHGYKNGLALQKLEVYKKWHANQQSTENLTTEKVKEDNYENSLPTPHKTLLKENTLPKLAPITVPAHKKSHPTTDKGSKQQGRTSREQTHSERTPSSRLRPDSPPAPIPPELLNRQYSNKSWHSWRNKNDSYAYDDVEAYIEDNELMDEEKEQWITKWVVEVNQAMKEYPPGSRESGQSLRQSQHKNSPIPSQ